MQSIIILKDVEVPDAPRFEAGQKVNIADALADTLVERGFAQYDQGKEAVTAEAKKKQSDFAESEKAEVEKRTKKSSKKII